jgi:hypothetical protein
MNKICLFIVLFLVSLVVSARIVYEGVGGTTNIGRNLIEAYPTAIRSDQVPRLYSVGGGVTCRYSVSTSDEYDKPTYYIGWEQNLDVPCIIASMKLLATAKVDDGFGTNNCQDVLTINRFLQPAYNNNFITNLYVSTGAGGAKSVTFCFTNDLYALDNVHFVCRSLANNTINETIVYNTSSQMDDVRLAIVRGSAPNTNVFDVYLTIHPANSFKSILVQLDAYYIPNNN